MINPSDMRGLINYFSKLKAPIFRGFSIFSCKCYGVSANFIAAALLFCC